MWVSAPHFALPLGLRMVCLEVWGRAGHRTGLHQVTVTLDVPPPAFSWRTGLVSITPEPSASEPGASSPLSVSVEM